MKNSTLISPAIVLRHEYHKCKMSVVLLEKYRFHCPWVPASQMFCFIWLGSDLAANKCDTPSAFIVSYKMWYLAWFPGDQLFTKNTSTAQPFWCHLHQFSWYVPAPKTDVNSFLWSIPSIQSMCLNSFHLISTWNIWLSYVGSSFA